MNFKSIGQANLLTHGLTTVVFAGVIALGLTLAGNQRGDVQLVYAMAIALISWMIIDLGRFVLLRADENEWPDGWRGRSLIGAGVAIGYVLGTSIGDWYCGCSTWELVWLAPGRFASYLVLTAAVAVVVTSFRRAEGQARTRGVQLAIAQRDAAEANLKLLQSQLEPHMLFNTLASLRVLIQTEPPRAVTMLDSLNRFLRSTLSASRQTWHPLSAEFERLRDYLELMAIRMGKRLRFELKLPEQWANQPIPPLLLQPLLENCIRHGLEPSVAGGWVLVCVSQVSETSLQVEVSDNGVGLTSNQRADGSASPLTKSDDSTLGGLTSLASKDSFGLNQVRARLDSAYQGRAQFELRPNHPTGTTARIVLPIDLKKVSDKESA